MANSLDLNAANDKESVADFGLGRNCTLFDKTRKWAYRAIRQGWPEYDQWLRACYERASAYNLQFAAPLDDSEVSEIAKNIAKWTFQQFNEKSFKDYVEKTHSSDIQSKIGAKSGVSRYEKSIEKRAPWAEMGKSRRKYYYLKSLLLPKGDLNE